MTSNNLFTYIHDVYKRICPAVKYLGHDDLANSEEIKKQAIPIL